MALQTPSMSLYVTNIESKVKKPELRAQLYALFTPYGRVIDVTAKKHDSGRGQAFVTFEDQASATAAMRGLTGESFYGKGLTITYSRKPSNATLARLDPAASRDAAAIKAAKLVVSRAQGEYEQLEKEREAEEAGRGKRELEDGEDRGGKRVKPDPSAAVAGAGAGGAGGDDDEMEIEMEEEDDDDQAESSSSGAGLICSNLPSECTPDVMSALFSQYTGFTKATSLSTPLPSSHPKQNPGAKAFRVDFSTKAEAEAALQPTKGYLMQPGWEMGVSLAS